MEVDWKPSFDEERRRYGFCFTCEHCSYFDDRNGECLHGFPNHMHRLRFFDGDPRPTVILFCKDFDLA
jgi:hypothetical protein